MANGTTLFFHKCDSYFWVIPKVRGKEDPYLKIGEVNDRTKPAARAVASSELLVTSENQSAEGGTGAQGLCGERGPQAGLQGFAGRENSEPNRAAGASGPATSNSLLARAPKAQVNPILTTQN